MKISCANGPPPPSERPGEPKNSTLIPRPVLPAETGMGGTGPGARPRRTPPAAQDLPPRPRTALVPAHAVAPDEPPVHDEASAFQAYVGLRIGPPRLHMDNMWKGSKIRRQGFEPLRQAYNKNRVDKLPGAEFLEVIASLTGKASSQARPAGMPDITLHSIRIAGVTEPVYVLRRTDRDGVADLERVHSDDVNDDAVQEMLRRMVRSARSSRSKLVTRSNNSHFRKLWADGPRPKEFGPLYDACCREPDFHYVGGEFFLWMLYDLTTKPQAVRSKTEVDGIDRFGIRIPGTQDVVQVLRRLDAQHELADIRLVPSRDDSKDQDDILDEMTRSVQKTQSLKSATSRRFRGSYVKDWTRGRLSQRWDSVAKELGDQYKAFRKYEIDHHRRPPSGATFAKHLNELCEGSRGDQVDDTYRIVRHRITPHGSSEPIVLLRYQGQSKVPTLRAVGKGPGAEAKALESIRHGIKSRMGVSARRTGLAAPADGSTADIPVPHVRFVKHSTLADRRPRTGAISDAHKLKEALELMVENKKAGRPLRHKVAASMKVPVPADALRAFIGKDGQLRRKASALPYLPGYAQVAQDLHGLFSELGHPDTADLLPQPMSAGLLARVLHTWSRNRSANVFTLARMLKANPRTIESYFKAQSGLLTCGDDRLRHLPGYAEHWTALRDALRDMGQGDRAKKLPKPETKGELFLRAIREDMYPMAAAVQAMKGDPKLSLRKAARLMSDSGETASLMKLLVRPEGMVRSRAEIEAQHADLKLHRLPELEGLLHELEGPRPSGMTRVLVPGFRAAKLFVVNRSKTEPGLTWTTKSKLAEVYANSPELVLPPRSYRHERDKQTLRWLATALRTQFKTTEVQCYYDAKKQQVWVSSNSSNTNRKIEEFLSGGELTQALSGRDGSVQAGRANRHIRKLGRKLAMSGGTGTGLGADILHAISKGRFRVPVETIFQHGKPIDLHAERRIKEAFVGATGRSFDHRLVAGTMRPCTVCAKDLGLPPSVHRGPAWLSRAAQAFFDANEVVEENVARSIGTYVSEMREGHLSVNYNTDSDSDSDADVGPAPLSSPLADAIKPRARRLTEIYAGSVPEAATVGGRQAKRPGMDIAVAARPDAAAADPLNFLTDHLDPTHTNWRSDLGSAWPPSPRQPESPPPAAPPSLGVVPRVVSQGGEQDLSILRNQAADAALLLGELGLQATEIPESQAQTVQVLQRLIQEGGRRFLAAVQRDQPPARGDAESLARIGELSARLRRSVALQGWLPQPTRPMPTRSLPASHSWSDRQLRQLFAPGSASGDRNICWFDTMAQLYLGNRRGSGNEVQEVVALAARLRQAADRLGLSLTGQMFDNDSGAMHVIASALGLQVHAFQQGPDGRRVLSSLHTVGSPADRPVYLHNDDGHFVPLWPTWEAREAQGPIPKHSEYSKSPKQ